VSRALVVLGVCVAVVVGGCGGGDDGGFTSSTTTEATTAITPPSEQGTSSSPQGEEKGKQGQGKTSGSSAKPGGSSAKSANSQEQGNGNSKEEASKRVKVPPISSAPVAGSRKPAPGVKTVKDGDNSVQEYGVESGEAERREASIALQAYLNARAEEDWGTACAYLAKRPMEQHERLQQAAAKQEKKLDGCAQTMALLREGEAQSEEQSVITEVLSFRGGGDISGDPSYLLYLAPPGSTLFSMPMYSEGGTWKVGLARAAELPVG
jgi:hypothetical protein